MAAGSRYSWRRLRTATCPRQPSHGQVFSTILAKFGHKECSIISVVAAVSPRCLLWGHPALEFRQ